MTTQTIPHNFHWYHSDYAACLTCNRTRNTISKDEPCPGAKRAKMVTPAMQAHADTLLSRSQKWARGIDHRSHRAFVCFSSSRVDRESKPIYWRTACDGSLCSCTGFLHRGICSHSVAVRAEAERAREQISRKAGPSYDDLMTLNEVF